MTASFPRSISGRFQAIRILGSGGMGVVYLARDTTLHRVVAVKTIRADALEVPATRATFLREAQLASRLEHPGVVPIYEFHDEAESPYLVMRYVRDESLGERLRREGTLPPDIAIRVLADLAGILAYAHGEGVVHRDLKPDNIFLEGPSNLPRPVLADFGIAHRPFQDHGPGERRMWSGTPHYMSPEQAAGDLDLDRRSDLFSLGVLGYQMLTGELPYVGTNDAAIAVARISGRRVPLTQCAPHAPTGLIAAIERCLEVEPDDRWPNAGELESALRAVDLGTAPRTRRRARPRRAPARAGLATATAVGRPVARPLGTFWMHVLRSELKVAVRSLRQTPVVSLAAVLCVTLGIGATTVIFSAVNTALLRPLPFREPNRLVAVYRTTPHFRYGPFSPGNVADLIRGTKTLSGLAAVAASTKLLERPDGGMTVGADRVTANWFSVLGVAPLKGRLLAAGDGDPGQPPVAVVAEEFWRARLGADTAVIGTVVRLGGRPYTIVGVIGRGFEVPIGTNRFESDFWVPLRFDSTEGNERRSNYLMLVGRLEATATLGAATGEFDNLMRGLVDSYPQLAGEAIQVLPLQREATRNLRQPLFMLLGAVGFVLLIAGVNVTSLLLARGVERQRDVAIRTALGASSSDILRRVLLETGLVVAIGAALGLGLAWTGTRLISAWTARSLPQLAHLPIDARVLGFSLFLAAATALLCGLVPARRALRTDPQEALRSGGRGGRAAAQLRFLRALSAAEFALSVTLLVGAGLVARGFLRLVQQAPGFDPENLLSLTVTVDAAKFPDGTAVTRFLGPALDQIAAVPGVTNAGAISLIPYQSWGSNSNVWYEGEAPGDPTKRPLVESRTVTPGYFATVGLSPTLGRLLTPADLNPDGPIVVVANQALADRDFKNRNPIGQRFHLGEGVGDTTFATIVGIVPNVRNAGPTADPQPEFYSTYPQWNGSALRFPLLIRTRGEPAAFAKSVVAALRSIDPGAAVEAVRPMTDVISRSVGTPRFYAVLLGTFTAIALVMALAGLYGVMSYGVALRTREIGIRTALGSSPAATVGLIGRQGAAIVLVGLVLGTVSAALLGRLLTGLLYGIDPLDPATFLVVAATMSAAAVVAVGVPALRATRVDPLQAIRTE